MYTKLASGGITVDLEWENHRLIKAVLAADRDCTIRLAVHGEERTLALKAGERYEMPMA